MDNKTKGKKKPDNSPMEVKISRRPINSQKKLLDTEKFVRRDPRFEASSGEFSEQIFEANYAFLKDIRKNEKEELSKHLKQVDDDERKTQINYLLNRLTNQEKAEEMKEKRKKNLEKIREEKGRKTFVNKSQLKKMEIVEKFKELKKSSKLQKYMERKRKKNANKDRRKFIRK